MTQRSTLIMMMKMKSLKISRLPIQTTKGPPKCLSRNLISRFHAVAAQGGCSGCNCTPNFQKLSHKNAIKHEFLRFCTPRNGSAPFDFCSLRGHCVPVQYFSTGLLCSEYLGLIFAYMYVIFWYILDLNSNSELLHFQIRKKLYGEFQISLEL